MLPDSDRTSPAAVAEKTRVALTSVLAAVVLTAAKIVVGIATGSLGVLSEAAHSALDLAAAVVTVLAVRASGKPADAGHPYGHGKLENLSALFEALLLLASCAWIIKEAVLRLFFNQIHIKSNIFAFIVIFTSILVDIGRSRALMKVARKYHSQALEADALHFATDIGSSAVVLLGLGLVYLADRYQLPWLAKADALAALTVAGIVVWVSIRLGKQTIDDLLDAVPPGLAEQAEQRLRTVPGVEAVLRVRLRRTGGEWFSDITVAVAPELPTLAAHQVADAVEAAMKLAFPGGDCVVHVEPRSDPAPDRPPNR